jgi:hypothetical protein
MHVLGLVINALGVLLPLARHRGGLQGISNHVTQSISLSNIHASSFAEEAEPLGS